MHSPAWAPHFNNVTEQSNRLSSITAERSLLTAELSEEWGVIERHVTWDKWPTRSVGRTRTAVQENYPARKKQAPGSSPRFLVIQRHPEITRSALTKPSIHPPVKLGLATTNFRKRKNSALNNMLQNGINGYPARKSLAPPRSTSV